MRGLLNLGNTCYFNSALQCLLQVPQLSNFLVLKEYSGTCEFTKEYQNIVRKIWLSKQEKNNFENPKKLLKLFKQKFKNFDNSSQHDCQEAFIYILEILENSLSPFKKINYPFESEKHSLIKDLFYGKTFQETICKNEKTSSVEDSIVHMLTPNKSLNFLEILKEHQKWNVLEDFVDTKGVKHHVATTRTMFWYTPSILVFSINMYTGKRRINLVDEFDSSEFVHPDSEYKNIKYKLFATCKHQGSVGSGHYVSYVKHRDKWYLKDDETCNEIENFPFSDYHYLILYKKII